MWNQITGPGKLGRYWLIAALLLNGVLLYMYGKEFPFLWISALIIGLALFHPKRYWIYILLLLVGWQGFQMSQYQKQTAFFYEKNFLESLPKEKAVVILTDSILIDKPLVHLEFQPASHIQWVDWNKAAADAHYDYLLYNYRRAGIMEDYFDRPVPEWVEALEGEKVVDNRFVFVLKN